MLADIFVLCYKGETAALFHYSIEFLGALPKNYLCLFCFYFLAHGPDTSVHEVNLKSSSEDRDSICRERNRNAPGEGNDNDGLDSTENGAKNTYTVDRAVFRVPYQEERVPQRIGSHLSGQSGLCKSQDSQNIGVKGNEGNRGMDKQLKITECWTKDEGDKKKDASKQTTAKSNSPLEANSSLTGTCY